MRKTDKATRQVAESSTPAQLGYRMPAEWEPHRATWITWPASTDWPNKLQAITWVYAGMVCQLSRGERVRILVKSITTRQRVKEQLRLSLADVDRVDFLVARTNRSWARDYLPQFVVKGRGRGASLGAVKFRFNGWARYDDYRLDEVAGHRVAQTVKAVWLPRVGTRRVVLEGGAIDVDGQGALLTPESCFLGKPYQRNPGLGRKAIEELLLDYLGASTVIWLPDGIAGDDTSGHIDDLARFVAPGKVVLIEEKNRRDANFRVLGECRERLQGARDAQGTKLEVIPLPMPAPLYFGKDRLPASYANFYIGNQVVVVPTFNDPADRVALGTLAELFPTRRVVGIHAVDLVLGLGTIHCSTQQEPGVESR